MTKDLYVAKLKNLSEQINLMLMEAEGLQEATYLTGKISKEAIEALKLSEKNLEMIAKSKNPDLILKFLVDRAGKAGVSLKELGVATDTKPALLALKEMFRSVKNYAREHAKGGIASIAVAVVAIITAPLLKSWRESSSLAEVTNITNKAIDAKKYQEVSKYINALQKINSNTTLWSKITTAQSARDLAASNVEAFKKSYITVGTALCIASIIAIIIFGATVDTFGPLIEAVKKLDFNGILVGLSKILGLGLLAVPALIGGCMIYIAMNGFPEEGMAAQVLQAMSPVVQLANQAVKSILELAQEAAAQGGQAQPARITRTTKKVK